MCLTQPRKLLLVSCQTGSWQLMIFKGLCEAYIKPLLCNLKVLSISSMRVVSKTFYQLCQWKELEFRLVRTHDFDKMLTFKHRGINRPSNEACTLVRRTRSKRVANADSKNRKGHASSTHKGASYRTFSYGWGGQVVNSMNHDFKTGSACVELIFVRYCFYPNT